MAYLEHIRPGTQKVSETSVASLKRSLRFVANRRKKKTAGLTKIIANMCANNFNYETCSLISRMQLVSKILFVWGSIKTQAYQVGNVHQFNKEFSFKTE